MAYNVVAVLGWIQIKVPHGRLISVKSSSQNKCICLFFDENVFAGDIDNGCCFMAVMEIFFEKGGGDTQLFSGQVVSVGTPFSGFDR